MITFFKKKRFFINTFPLKHQNGVTLVELIIAIFILGVIAGIIGYVYATQSSGFRNQKTKLELQNKAKNTIEIIQKDIKEAINVEENAIPNNTSLVPSSTVLILKTPAQDTNGSVLYDAGGQILYFDYIIFEVAAGNIVKKYVYPATQSARVETISTIGTDIQSASFAYYPSGPSITTTTSVGITLSAGSNNISSNFQEQIVKLRNK